ncbi:hypothetical protein AnigIFM56816_005860 [Aspergillus niger]|nr:hypothetical protein AnigIFM56816_005860 [Aspergillus niger]
MFKYNTLTPEKDEETHDATSNSLSTEEEGIIPLLDENAENQRAHDGIPTTRVSSYSFVVLLVGVLSFIFSVLFYAVRHSYAATDSSCQRRMWAYSPESDFLQYESRQYDSDLISHDFVGVPTQSRRDAWDTLWKSKFGSSLQPSNFPYDKLPAINKSTEEREWWSLPPPREQEVIAMSEAMHQVHCVGVLWFFVHRNEWDYRTAINKTEEFMQIHSRHCSVMLMNLIKCMADVTPVLFQKDTGNVISGTGLGAWKPRDAPRRCKRFDKIWDWERKNSICPMGCVPEDIARLYPGTA